MRYSRYPKILHASTHELNPKSISETFPAARTELNSARSGMSRLKNVDLSGTRSTETCSHAIRGNLNSNVASNLAASRINPAIEIRSPVKFGSSITAQCGDDRHSDGRANSEGHGEHSGCKDQCQQRGERTPGEIRATADQIRRCRE